MKSFFPLLVLAYVLFGCEKPSLPEPEVHPAMHYTDLHLAEVKHNEPKSLDINADGTTDFTFSTLLVGDPVLHRDRLQFYATSKLNTALLNNNNDQSPMLNKTDTIAFAHTGYEWFEISAIVLAEKITEMTGLPYWDGLWKNAAHKYLPVQVRKDGLLYLGWVEISFDILSEKLILHKAAI